MGNRILIIAEKKQLAIDIANTLGKPIDHGSFFELPNYDVVPAQGHLLSQAQAEDYDPKYKKWRLEDLPINPPVFKMVIKRDKQTGETNRYAKNQLTVMKRLMANASQVINAGDPDREGQIIVDEILTFLGCKLPTKRLWLHKQTTEGIRDGMANLKDNRQYEGLSKAAKCRAEADWLVGINNTRGYTVAWQSRGHEGVFNVGRVKTPVIGLVVQREIDIENFKPQTYFVIKATIKTLKGNFDAKWIRGERHKEGFDSEGRLLDGKIAQSIVDNTIMQMGIIEEAKRERVKVSPPLLFSLGDLQKLAYGFGLSPDRTLEIAQSLYDTHKLTSYPRTSCAYAPESEWKRASTVISALKENFGDQWDFAGRPEASIKSPAWNDKKLGAHYAIIPLETRRPVANLSKDEQLVYRLIVRQYIAQFHPDYEYDATKLVALVNGERFGAYGQVPGALGWHQIIPLSKANKDDSANAPLPSVNKGEQCRSNPVVAETAKTKPPPRYNGGTLLDAMEEAWKLVSDPKIKATIKQVEGIGTDATRSNIIKECLDGGFFVETKIDRSNVYIPTQKGRIYMKAVDPDLTKVDLTAYVEGQLEQIKDGKLEVSKFRELLERFMNRILVKVKDGTVAASMPSPDQVPPDTFGKKKTGKAGSKLARSRSGLGSKTPEARKAGSQTVTASRRIT